MCLVVHSGTEGFRKAGLGVTNVARGLPSGLSRSSIND